MASKRKGGRLNHMSVPTLWPTHEEDDEENDYTSRYVDQDEYASYDDDEDETKWKDLTHGVKVFIPSLAPGLGDAIVLPMTNDDRADKTIDGIKLPCPCIFVTDIFEIQMKKEEVGASGSKSNSRESDKRKLKDLSLTLIASKRNHHYKMTIRIEPDKYEFNSRHYFGAEIRRGKNWSMEPAKYKNGEFWFHAEKMSAFFIYAASMSANFKIEKAGTTFSPMFDKRIELEVPENAVKKTEEFQMKVWPTYESKLQNALHQTEKYSVSAMTDTIFFEHTANKFHKEVSLKMPLHGDTSLKSDEHMFLYTCNNESSDFDYEKLKKGDFSIKDGMVCVQKVTVKKKG